MGFSRENVRLSSYILYDNHKEIHDGGFLGYSHAGFFAYAWPLAQFSSLSLNLVGKVLFLTGLP